MLKQRLLTKLAGILAILFVAAILGYTFPAEKAPVAQPTAPASPRSTLQAAPITLAEVKEKLDKGERIVLVDARTDEEYEAGHIKGAISLPFAKFNERYSAVQGRLPEDAELVAYCSGSSCGLSQALADVLIAKGFSHVRVFFGGWPEWLAAGYPVERGG